MLRQAIVFALIFSPVAALSAYLITYAEYRRHFPEDLRRARKISVEFALSAFVFFFILIVLAVIFINKYFP
ncbi:MAG TPA: hypothetical protein PLB50_08730 [Candidatus Saccharicenans sp.]|nr:hypothetical protein [Candidatus Saccharicenans sp.]HQO76748.1 hypothetical protein [Candidatus Saccharicenans sp.]HUM79854.1 hypothetical protein [Candidatus Saccharicenans sp.]